MLRAVLLTISWTLLAGCAPMEEPVYDDDLGLQGVASEPGSLAGTFVYKTSIVTLADLPVDGIDQTAGGETYFLMHRTWDESSESYTQRAEPCGGRIYETGGTESEITLDRWQMVPEVTAREVNIDHATGVYSTRDHAELWAINLPDPINDAMPVDGTEAMEEPHASRIYDIDEDGNPGMTMSLEGLATGDVYFCQRRAIQQDGLRLDNGEGAGLLEVLYEQVVLGASNPLLNQALPRQPHPNPKEAWFWEAPLADDAGCDEVLQAVSDEVVPRINPFI